jgi:hypothetical protein
MQVVVGVAQKLSFVQLHDLFQKLGKSEIAKSVVVDCLENGYATTRDKLVQDEQFKNKLMQVDSIYELMQTVIAECNEECCRMRMQNAINASEMLEGFKLKGGNMWRVKLHLKQKGKVGRKLSYDVLNCAMRNVDRGGLSIDGDFAKLVESVLNRTKRSLLVVPRTSKEWDRYMQAAIAAQDTRRRAQELPSIRFHANWARRYAVHEECDDERDESESWLPERVAERVTERSSGKRKRRDTDSEDDDGEHDIVSDEDRSDDDDGCIHDEPYVVDASAGDFNDSQWLPPLFDFVGDTGYKSGEGEGWAISDGSE